eukprot:425466-Prorocentrum_minimum.AAC.1
MTTSEQTAAFGANVGDEMAFFCRTELRLEPIIPKTSLVHGDLGEESTSGRSVFCRTGGAGALKARAS